MSMSNSSGSSTQESTSTPTFLETPENAILDHLSGVAEGLAAQMNSWAQSVFAQTSQITNQAVGNFFQVSQKMMGLADNMTGQYNNLFAPENAQLVADANSFASPERMKVDMGMAGATQAQAGDQALKNSEQNLLSYGIDPSSGRYAALDKAAAVQNAANVAGAENMQRNQDIATGQRLRSEAVQVGAQLPAAISNANNTAIQANTGASNATLANANTGANLNRLSNEYLKTAMDLKLPPTGQNSQSKGQSSQNSHSSGPPPKDSDHGGGQRQPGSGGPGQGGGSGGGGPAWMPQHGGGGGSGGGGGRGNNTNPSAGIKSFGDGGGGPDWGGEGQNIGAMYDDVNGADFSYLDNYGGDYSSGTGSIGQQQYDSFDYGGSNPFSDSGFGQTFDYGGPNQTYGGLPDQGNSDMGWGNYTYDAGANNVDPGWENTYDQPAQWPDAFDSGTSGYDNYGGGDSYFGADYGYAGGGQVQQPGGGPVPRQASPSNGNVTDDVRANLNAGEFVIPKDVAAWKGGEFFHNLIAKSRKLRATAPGGKPMPQGDPRAQQAPSFSTR